MEQIQFPSNLGDKELLELLQSKAGKQLIELLKQKDGAILRKAAAAAKNGQYDKAFEALAPLMEGTDASKLAMELKKNHG